MQVSIQSIVLLKKGTFVYNWELQKETTPVFRAFLHKQSINTKKDHKMRAVPNEFYFISMKICTKSADFKSQGKGETKTLLKSRSM